MTWPTDQWEGCYPSHWKGVIVPDAITHPAKFSSRLIRRIYDHMLREGWLKAGDMVIDPFGGVALGALDAMRRGLRWRGMELEARFAELGNKNIDLWNAKFSRMPGWCQDSALIQGDSRHLIEALQEADTAVTSPPYAESMNQSHAANDGDARIERMRAAGVDVSKSVNLGGPNSIRRKPQNYSQAAVASPPYSEARIGQESGQEHAGRGDQYGPTPGQLGAMKAESFDAALASPPFRQATGGTPEPKPGGPIDAGLYKRHAAGNSSAEGYGATDGQLANMPEGDIQAAISSPPYAEMPVEKNSGSVDRQKQWETYRASGGGQSFEAFCRTQELHSHGYGNTDGQLGGMKDGGHDAAVTSPPYEAVQIASIPGSGTDVELRKKLRASGEWEGYNRENKDNLGSNAGDDFWMAARQIVEQVYTILRPGAHAVWVVKGFVKNKELVDFPGQWRQLCEAVGFTMVHEHHAMLVHHKGASHTLDGGIVEHKTESKSFFRRLAESKGSPRIDYETILCMVKGG
jgi:hypothetical protein